VAMPLPVASLIDLFDQGPITITRAGSGTINAYGEVTPAATSQVVLERVAVHVLTGLDLAAIPAGDGNHEAIKVYTTEALYTSEDTRTADLVPYEDRWYRVITSKNINTNGRVWVSVAQLLAVAVEP